MPRLFGHAQSSSAARREVIHTRKLTSATAGTAPSAAPAARPARGLMPSGAGPPVGTLMLGRLILGKLKEGPGWEGLGAAAALFFAGFCKDLISARAAAASRRAASSSALAAASASSGVGSGGGGGGAPFFDFEALGAAALAA